MPRFVLSVPLGTAIVALLWGSVCGQDPPRSTVPLGDGLALDAREMFERGLQYLVVSQDQAGDWPGNYRGAGTTGLAVLAFLASGEDPNFGTYHLPVERALISIATAQDPQTGYLGDSMYQHGFAMLGLAEAYGVVDEQRFDPKLLGGRSVSLGKSLEMAVRLAVTAQQKNSVGGWRYTPDSSDADTSVSGAMLMGLLAARNAGIEVPDATIDRAIAYFVSMTSGNGAVTYSGGFGGFEDSLARTSITSLVYAVAHRQDLPQYAATVRYLRENLDANSRQWAEYTLYYQSQALFHADKQVWEKWNRRLVERLKQSQKEDGSFASELPPPVGTSLSLLALALNDRFLPIYER